MNRIHQKDKYKPNKLRVMKMHGKVYEMMIEVATRVASPLEIKCGQQKRRERRAKKR
jgi:uncharacterized membrane protein (UPF0127 family)